MRAADVAGVAIIFKEEDFREKLFKREPGMDGAAKMKLQKQQEAAAKGSGRGAVTVTKQQCDTLLEDLRTHTLAST